MGTQEYRANYYDAFECANHHLDHIYNEYHQLQARKQQLEGALAALQPFLQSVRMPESARIAEIEEFHQPEPVRMDVTREPEPFPEPVAYTPIAAEPFRSAPTPEPPFPPSYAPVSETNLDPIQDRINRALGLAVA